MNNTLEIQEQNFSLVGKNSQFQGSFQFNGPTRLSGRLNGELVMNGEFDLVIETEGFFEGTIRCHEVEIYGHFKGTLNSPQKVTIYPSAKVSGDIQTKNLIIHPGALVNIDGKTLQ